MEEQPENSNLGVWTGLVIVLGVLVIGLFARRFSVIILLVLSLGILIGGIYYLMSYIFKWSAGKQKSRTIEGKIEKLRKECTAQIAKHRNEIEEIKNNIKDIDKRLNDGFEVNPKSMEESQRLKRGFQKELQLRETKITFYETCRGKLENMLYNQRLVSDLEEKQKKLSQLQEEHHQDIAHMEQLRTEVEFEKRFINSIGQLSHRMAAINSLDTAEELQLELKEITKEMRRL